MSLNGLETAAVQEAYQAAIAEAGGWLLLKYASRDSVELLGRGKGGVHEARTAIAKYEEASPVYGVIVYRRRKVFIKFIPDGTSRVLLARTTVHLQDVLEKFSPYEALLEISTAEGLNDTSLAASFPLHTATPSGSSSRLDEITEDGEDPGPSKASPAPSPATRTPAGSYFASQRHRMERRMELRTLSDRSPTQSIDSTKAARPISPLSSNLPSPMKTSVSQFLVRSDSGKPSITSLGLDSVASMGEYTPSEASVKDTQSSLSTVEPSKPNLSAVEPLQQDLPGLSSEPSFSETSPRSARRGDMVETQQPSEIAQPLIEKDSPSTRPSVSEQSNYENDLLDFLKPKMKLGPRPITAAERAKRPTKATVSSMPATYRFSMRKQEQPRQTAPGQTSAPSPTTNKPLPAPPPIPESPDYNPRPLSRGSVKSMPSHKSTAMTPDKLRLMKAVELRKKQLRKSNPLPEDFVPPPDEEIPVVPKVPEQLPVQEDQTVTRESESVIASQTAKDNQHDGIFASYKADSGIEMDYEKGDVQKSTESVEAPPVEDPERISSEHTQRPSEDSMAPPPRESPKLAIPGAFSDPTTPEAELEPTLDPSVHLAEEDELTRELTESPVASATADGPVTTVSPEEDRATIPTIVMADGSRPITPSGQQTKEDDSRSIGSDIEGRSGDESVGSSCGLATAWEMSPKRKNSDLARRRQGYVEPLHVDTDTECSDDDLMDELQSAQVEEAKHVTVSRSSPVQEFFQRRPSARSQLSDAHDIPKEIRAVSPSSPVSIDNSANITSPSTESKKEPPATYRPKAPTADGSEPLAGLKRNVSSEISKRIQALAETSNRESSQLVGPALHPLTPDTSSNAILSSARSPTHSRNRSFNALTRYSSRANANQNQILTSAPQQPQTGPVWSVQHNPNTNRESVSVTARIVRPRPSEETESHNSADTEFHQSELLINHKRRTPSQTTVPQLQRIDTKSNPPAPKQESTTPLNATSPTLSRMSKEAPRIPQGKAVTSPPADGLPPPSPLSPYSVPIASNDENVVPKEGNRTSRFFKRMSHIGGKRRSGIQQLAEGTNPAAAIAKAPSKEKVEIQSIMLPAVTVGDLNIQFPDSLLWKRRILAIDAAGYMKFLPTEHQKASTRRFQMSEFKMPYVPDLDREELPNSIMLDFVDGTTLQISCEDSVTHLQVSHVLKTYWKAWARSG